MQWEALNSPPFPADWNDFPDDKLGEALLECWVGYQVAAKGTRAGDTAEALAKKILIGTSLMNTSAARHAALEKALHCATSGRFAEAGRLTRDLVHDKASLMRLKEWAAAGAKHRQEQSLRAQKPRGKVTDEGETIHQVICRIAKSEPEDSSKELWPRLVGELDHLHLNTTVEDHPKDPKKSYVEYDNVKGTRRRLTFGQFAKVVSAFRTGKELP